MCSPRESFLGLVQVLPAKRAEVEPGAAVVATEDGMRPRLTEALLVLLRRAPVVQALIQIGEASVEMLPRRRLAAAEAAVQSERRRRAGCEIVVTPPASGDAVEYR